MKFLTTRKFNYFDLFIISIGTLILTDYSFVFGIIVYFVGSLISLELEKHYND